MNEYEELREKIVGILDDYELKGLEEFGGAIHNDSLQKADLLLSIIAEKCWFKDEGIAGRGTSMEKRMYYQLRDKGWRPVKEIKKEAK